MDRERIDRILERTASYYEMALWEEAPGARARLLSAGLEEESLRRFQIGWAPRSWQGLLDHLSDLAPDPADLVEAGIARSRGGGRTRVHFHHRITFPVRDRDGRILGFAAMATSPGPSWTHWITSPEGPLYSRDAALFGIDTARKAIARGRHALVLTDCLEVLRLRQAGEDETVAVMRSAVKPAHLDAIAAELGAEPGELAVRPTSRAELDGAVVVCPAAEVERLRHKLGERLSSAPGADRDGPGGRRPLSRPERALLTATPFVLGAGVPLAWVAIIHPDPDAPDGPGAKLAEAAGGMALTYAALALAALVLAAWLRRRPRTAWTPHRLGEVLVGAVLVSVVAWLVLFVALGGFGG